jgi:hypothetical protein
MWNNLKKKILENLIIEFKNQDNWNNIEELFITPFSTKMKYHLNKYLFFFLTINILIMILIIIHIIITINLYYKK